MESDAAADSPDYDDNDNDEVASSDGEEHKSYESSSERSVTIVSHKRARESEQAVIGKGKGKMVEGELQELLVMIPPNGMTAKRATSTKHKRKRSGSESDADDNGENGKCFQ